jgi:hypothetical protein
MEVPSTSSDPSYIPQICQEPRLIEQSECNDPARDANVSEQSTELLGSRTQEWNLLAEGTRIPIRGRRNQKLSQFYGTQDPLLCVVEM